MDMVYTHERVMGHLGLTVRVIRKKRQFTQEKLSEKSGIANPTVKKICALAEALGVAPETLFNLPD